MTIPPHVRCFRRATIPFRAGRPGRATIIVSLLLCSAMLATCFTSPKPQEIPHATNPYGARGTVTLAYGRTYEGELLALTDTSLVMLVDGRVATVRSPAIVKIAVPSVGDVAFTQGRAASAKKLERARRMMRFPYGMSPEVTAALLAKSSQASPDDLGAKSK